MFIDEDGLNLTRSVSGNSNAAGVTELSQTTANQSTDNSPGFAPISPNTPSWGPPSGTTTPVQPSPVPSTPSLNPSTSVTITPPIVVIPGQNSCSCYTAASTTTPNTPMANIRFLHAAVNQPAVTIRLGNRTVINNMPYGSFTPYYLHSGSQRTLVTVINTQSGQTLYQAYLNPSDNTAYTIAIVNSGSGISLFTVTDTACTSRNVGCLRAVNLSPNSGAVDVFLAGYGRVFQNLGQLTATDYRTIQQGTYRASVSETLPCSGNSAVIMADGYVECNNTRIAIMDSATFNVMNGVSYTLYIIGLANGFPALQILVVESDLNL